MTRSASRRDTENFTGNGTKLHEHPGVLRGEQSQLAGEKAVSKTVGRADADGASNLGLTRRYRRERRSRLDLDALGQRDQALASFGQHAAGRSPFEQSRAKLRLQRIETARHGGVVDTQPCAPQRKAVRYGATARKHAKMIPVHVFTLMHNGFPSQRIAAQRPLVFHQLKRASNASSTRGKYGK